MTVAAGKTPFHSYFPGGAMAPELIPFEFFSTAELRVRNATTGAMLTEGTHYAVAGDSRAGTATIMALVAVDLGVKWELWSETAIQQQLDLVESMRVPLQQFENELDRRAIVERELDREIARAHKSERGQAGVIWPSLATLTGKFLTVSSTALIAGWTPAEAAAQINPFITAAQGPQGNPGANVMAVGLGTEIDTMTIPNGTDVIHTSGYAAPGDYGAARYVAIAAPDAAWTWPRARDRWMIETANGRWFMLDPSQSVRPEMFGAVGDAEHFPGNLTTSVFFSDDPTIWQSDVYTGPNGTGTPTDDWEALRCMTDYCTFIGRGLHIEHRPGAIYWFADPRKATGGANQQSEVKRYDGRWMERIEDYDDDLKWNPSFDGVDGLTWNWNGSRVVQAPYHIPEAGHKNDGDPRWHARGFKFYKCQNFRITGYRLDMNWRNHTSWSGRAFQRNERGIKATGCRNFLFDFGWVHDSPLDGVYLAHRFESGIGGMAGRLDSDLTNTVGSNGPIYWPHGENENIVFRNFDVSNCARQAMSIIGGRRIFILGGRWSGTRQYLGTAPRNTSGAAGHGLFDYRLPGLPPGCWIDAEPNREHPRGVEFVTVIGARVVDNFSMWGATGQGDFTRVEKSFTSANVDVGNNTITITGNPRLPTAILLQRVRLYNIGGALPGGIERYVNYWINRAPGSDTFTLHRSRRDAINGVNPVNITDGGTGTHRIAVFRAKSQVHNIRLIDCDFDHPANGGDLLPGESTRLYIHGGSLFNRSRTRALGDAASYTSQFDIEGMEISAYASAFTSDDTTKSEVVTADDAADTINGTTLRLDPYDFTVVRFFSTGNLPAPLVSNQDYFATHINDDQCKLSISEEAARAGVYIDMTSTGSGTITMHQQGAEWNVRNNRFRFVVPEGFEFDAAADVDTTANTINFPDAHEFGNRGEDRCQFRPVAGATMPAPLVAGTVYYPVAVDETRIIVCASPANAQANPPVPISLTGGGSGYVRTLSSSGSRVSIINQRGTWDNNDFWFDRRNYPVGASSIDAVVFRRSGETRNLHFRTDLPAGEGIIYAIFEDSPQTLIDSMTFMANGTTALKDHTANRISFDRPRQDRVTWWTTNTNQTFNPRTGGKAGLLDVPITANRTFTLSTTGAFEGQVVEVRRTVNATGAFTFSGHGATLSNAGEAATFIYRSGAWVWIGV